MFVKLFSSITESSLWSEPKEVRLLFVTMLAKANQIGFVEASLPGLARVANLSMEETVSALECLQSPDKFSKNPENEGRRIISVPGGFMILNYEDYRERRNVEERQEYMRNYMKAYRKRKQTETDVNTSKPPLAKAEAEAEAEARRERESQFAESLEIPKSLDTDQFRKAWRDWLNWNFSRFGLRIDSLTGQEHLRQCNVWGPDKSVENIRHTIGNRSTQGGIWEKRDFQAPSNGTGRKRKRFDFSIYEQPEQKSNDIS